MDFKLSLRSAIPGMAVTGFVGGLIGSFLGQWFYLPIGALIGAMVGYVVWSFGERLFFLFIIMGGLSGGLLSFYLAGESTFILGAAVGGAIGGFLGVNATLLRRHGQ
ncbi:MAG: hypothetical protein AAB300_04605 [Nitrospirota bacterium]